MTEWIVGVVVCVLVCWVVGFFAYWKGRSDGVLAERERWSGGLKGHLWGDRSQL